MGRVILYLTIRAVLTAMIATAAEDRSISCCRFPGASCCDLCVPYGT